MNVTVYSKPLCVQCDATKREMKKKGIGYDVVDVTEDADALAEIKEMGFMAAPVVCLRNESGEVVDSWSGFRKERILSLLDSVAESIAPRIAATV